MVREEVVARVDHHRVERRRRLQRRRRKLDAAVRPQAAVARDPVKQHRQRSPVRGDKAAAVVVVVRADRRHAVPISPGSRGNIDSTSS